MTAVASRRADTDSREGILRQSSSRKTWAGSAYGGCAATSIGCIGDGSTRRFRALFVLPLLLAACQTTGDNAGKNTPTDALASAAAEETAAAEANSDPAGTASSTQTGERAIPEADNRTSETALAAANVATANVTTVDAAVPAACAVAVPGGPPPKPAKGADFGRAAVKNTGKGIQRGIIQQIGGAVAGGLGAAIAGAGARATIRSEQDIKGVWTITDGAADCGCTVTIDSLWQLTGKGNDAGKAKPYGCNHPLLTRTAHWALGYSFTGYGAKFELKSPDKKTVLASMKRDGMHYFSGTLADGTPVTMWRKGQNHHQLRKYK